jgi:hypothetical protein
MGTTATTEMPDGERLARLETRAEHLEQQNIEIRADLRDLRAKIDRNLLWILGGIITMWVSLAAMWVTSMLTLLNKLGS